MVPLFGAIPGGPELLVILLVLVFLFGVPLALLLGGGVLGARVAGGSNGDDGRLDELERELAETKAELRELREREGTSNDDDADGDVAEPSGSTDSSGPVETGGRSGPLDAGDQTDSRSS